MAFKSAGATSGSSNLHEFVVDVMMPDQEVFRAVVLEPHLAADFRMPFVGSQVGVEVDAKSHKVRFDKSDPRLSVKARKRDEADQFDELRQRSPADAIPVSEQVVVRERSAELRRETDEQLDELQRKLAEKGLLPRSEEG